MVAPEWVVQHPTLPESKMLPVAPMGSAFAGSRLMRQSWRSGSAPICVRATARGGWTRHRMRTVVSSCSIQCWSSSSLPLRAGIHGCRGGAPRGGGALANLVSGGTASAPRSLIRVGGAPRRATPLYVIGAARRPTSRHGRRSSVPPGRSRTAGLARSVHSIRRCSRRPVSLPPCRSRHRSVRPASAPSLAAWYRPGGIARARSGAFAPGQRP